MKGIITVASPIISILLLSGFNPAQAAPILEIENDILRGATGVNVNGSFYDVSFQEGTCLSLYDGCSDPSVFAFQTKADAEAASLALLDQVLINTESNTFDLTPSATFGCVQLTRCFIYTPFEFNAAASISFPDTASVALALNAADAASGLDDVFDGSIQTGTDTRDLPDGVFAVWKAKPAVSVPEPGSLALLGVGLALMGVTRYRRALLLRNSSRF